MIFSKEEIENLDWHKSNGLIPAIIQDYQTLQVLMLGFMNQESLTKSIETQKVTFYSRTKQRIWQKGETSKNFLYIVEIKVDCDKDSLLILSKPIGNTCHLDKKSCFKTEEKNHINFSFLVQLQNIIQDKKKNPKNNSYTSNLFTQGLNKISQKFGEESVEVIVAALNESKDNLKNEVSDLFFHLLVLLEEKQIKFSEILEVLETRNNKNK